MYKQCPPPKNPERLKLVEAAYNSQGHVKTTQTPFWGNFFKDNISTLMEKKTDIQAIVGRFSMSTSQVCFCCLCLLRNCGVFFLLVVVFDRLTSRNLICKHTTRRSSRHRIKRPLFNLTAERRHQTGKAADIHLTHISTRSPREGRKITISLSFC